MRGIVWNKGGRVKNGKRYEVSLKKDIVEGVMDEICCKMEMICGNIESVKRRWYNGKEVFLEEICVEKKG